MPSPSSATGPLRSSNARLAQLVSAAATPLGCRANARLAQSQPPLGKGFRGVNRERQGVGMKALWHLAYREASTLAFADAFNAIMLAFITATLLVPLLRQVTPAKAPAA